MELPKSEMTGPISSEVCSQRRLIRRNVEETIYDRKERDTRGLAVPDGTKRDLIARRRFIEGKDYLP